MTPLQTAIFKTLVYADLFSYPLKLDDLHERLIGVRSSKKTIESAMKKIPDISSDGMYYYLSGRENCVKLRVEKEKVSKKKKELAMKVASLLGNNPWVKMVCLTGTVASGNASLQDDIDFFVLSAAGKIWTARFFCTIAAEIFFDRRKPGDRVVRDKICLNMYLDEQMAVLQPERQNIYTAYEILQMKPLYDRDGAYNRFICLNPWIGRFLPNWYGIRAKECRKVRSVEFSGKSGTTEKIFRWIQKRIMSDTDGETIEEGMLFFHRGGNVGKIIERYSKTLMDYSHTPLDKLL